ncbi:MAG: DUF3244 domain-containing protein [Bacteroidaceae bacterium]|nr:DUF3244 domain-containing protein [Bacteroidaceae bacterium]
MNKKKLLLSLLLIISTSIVSGMNSTTEESQKDIALNEKKSWENSDKPRSLDKLNWTCYYENGFVYLNVPSGIGVVTLTVTNLTTGEVWNYRQDSGFGWIILATAETQGNYMVVVGTESYGNYIGYYTL